jgi:negative regulator of replication initiation
MKSIKKFVFLLILVSSWNSTAFSQKATFVNGDTLICFTQNQSKFILEQIYRMEELDTLLKIQIAETQILNSQVEILKENLTLSNEKIQNTEQIISNNQALLNQAEKEIKILNRRLRFQKVRTYIFTGVAVATSSIFLYLYVTK